LGRATADPSVLPGGAEAKRARVTAIFVVPWTNLAATAIVVPLLATGVAATSTPSRLPLVRRGA